MASPYAPQKVGTSSGGAQIGHYVYDAASNRLTNKPTGSLPDQTITMGLLTKPRKITTDGAGDEQFFYKPGGSRYLRVHADGRKTLYVNGMEYRLWGNTPQPIVQIHAKGYSPDVQVDVSDANSPDYTYLLKDHLGSPLRQVDDAGNAQDGVRYDPWGREVAATGVADAFDDVESAEQARGYNGHELIASANLGHWNGRVFDYGGTGGFVGPDKFIQGRSIAALNRFALGHNNNPNVTDPSGWKGDFGLIGNDFNRLIAANDLRVARSPERQYRRFVARAAARDAQWRANRRARAARFDAREAAGPQLIKVAAEAAKKAAVATESGLLHHQRFYIEDLSEFEVTHIPEVEISPSYQILIDEFPDLHPDPNYRAYPDLGFKKDGSIYVGNAGKRGWGLFAGKKLNKNDFIGRYSGVLTTALDRNSTYSWSHSLFYSIDGKEKGNLLRFANDADPLNLRVARDFANNILYYADRDIEPGEELLVSYGENYWRDRDRTRY